jgi:two-component system cell cycle sensor histidine kinase/response regulator CckA
MVEPGRKTLATVLVVEDDEALLNAVVTILENSNFRVIPAGSPDFAINLAEETEGEIQLLLSAVDFPTMSGPALGRAIRKARPAIHVMMMSGQANGNLLVLNYGWAYIQKRFLAAKLVSMVTSVLQAPDRSQLSDEFDSAKDVREAR